MTNQQAPEALPPIQRFYRGTDRMAENQAGDWVRYEDHVAALVEAQQQPAVAHKACKPDMLVNGGALKLALNVLRRAGKREVADELEATAKPSPTPQADSQPAPIDMVLHCPACGLQHIDAPDWQNDPQLGAIRYANAQQRIDTSGDREAQQSHHEPVQVLLRDGGMASGGHAEQPVQEVQLPATAIHEANKGMHVVSAGNGRFTVLQGQQNGQPSSEVQGLPQERNRRLEEDQSGRGESGGTPPKQSAARDEAIRLDARGVSGAPESSGSDLQHLREGRAPEAQEGPSIAGSLPCNGQDSGRAVLSLQHDAGLRERRLNVASQRDQVSCEAPLRAPIHRSHLCRPEDGGCGHIWRPADVPTNGVQAVKTTGKADSPIAARTPADSVTAPAGGEIDRLRAQVASLTRDCDRQASKIAELIADLKFQDGKHREDRAQLQTIYEHQRGECWYWQGDGQDHLESLCSTLPVVIRADQLRALASTPPAQAADSVQDLQPVHDAVTIDLLNERVAYLERKIKEADSVLEDAARYRWLARKVSAHGICDGWQFGFPTALTLPANALAMTDPETALGQCIDAAMKKGGAT